MGVSQSPRTGSTGRMLTAFRDPGRGSQAHSWKPYLHWLRVSSYCRVLPVLLGLCRRMRRVAGRKLTYPIFNLPERDRPHFLSSSAKLRRSSDGPASGQVPLCRAGVLAQWPPWWQWRDGGERAAPRRRRGSIPRNGRKARPKTMGLQDKAPHKTMGLPCKWGDCSQRRG